MKLKLLIIIILTTMTLPQSVLAQSIKFNEIGTIKSRHAKEIAYSNWSVGAETMDRDYTIYDNWKKYLGPLGVKKARIQAGWAKTEFEIGKYNFQWLDSIIYDMIDQGIEPWVNVSYGNPIYASGGETRLGAKMPKSAKTINAFAEWAKLLAARYKNHIDEWEIWNEGIHRNKNSVDEYIDLYVPAAEAIRAVQPEAKLLALAIAGIHPEQADEFLRKMKALKKLHLVDEITFHPYRKNPDEVYDEVLELRLVVKKYSNRIKIRQGENGAPSEYRDTKALRDYEWSELSQAKWALRRLLGDLGRDIESSYFSIVDLNYLDEINRKGLLHANEDQQVVHKKPAYSAVQHLTSVFDHTVERLVYFPYETSLKLSHSLFSFQNKVTGQQLIAIWLDGDVPSDENIMQYTDFTFYGGKLNNPVYTDLRTGKVYEIPDQNWAQDGSVYKFTNIPVYDSPVVICDASNIQIIK